MGSAWTGGQYSVFRLLFGAYLCVHFLQLLPWAAEVWSSEGVLGEADRSPLLFVFPNVFALADGPAFVTAVIAAAALASVMLSLGWRDRWAAVVIWYVWACLFGRNPLISNPGLPYVGLLLMVHAWLPRAPYGSLEARGRSDPGGGWRMEPSLFAATWVLMAAGYTFSGLTKLTSPSWLDGTALARVLDNPLARPGGMAEVVGAFPDGLLLLMAWGALGIELLFAPLACFRRLRPWVWAGMLGLHLGLITMIDFADLSLGMVMLHAATFDPGWVRRRVPSRPEILYYDGGCGLCHGFVRMLLAEDRGGLALRFAPLQSETFAREVPADLRSKLPDSVVLQCEDGRWLVRSDAALKMLRSLGGLWGVAAVLAGAVPRSVLDRAYDLLARHRRRLVKKPTGVCPILPSSLAERFLP